MAGLRVMAPDAGTRYSRSETRHRGGIGPPSARHRATKPGSLGRGRICLKGLAGVGNLVLPRTRSEPHWWQDGEAMTILF